MTHLTEAAHVAFARQHGVASVQQLLDSGLTARHVERLEQVGAIELVLRGVYRSKSVHLDELGRCRGALSHATRSRDRRPDRRADCGTSGGFLGIGGFTCSSRPRANRRSPRG